MVAAADYSYFKLDNPKKRTLVVLKNKLSAKSHVVMDSILSFGKEQDTLFFYQKLRN